MGSSIYEHSTCPICDQPLEVICTERGYGVTVDDRGEISDGWHSKDFSAELEITCPNDHAENEMHALWNGDDLHPLIKLGPEATAALEVKVNAQDNLSRTQEYFISAAQVVYEMAQLAFEKVDQMEYEDSRDVVTAVITQAMEFEELHKNTNWDSEDFLFAVEASFDENILKRWAKKEQ